MSEDANKREDREFQYEITKLQVDFQSTYALTIGALAILYGLLVFYRDNPLGFVLTIILISVVVVAVLPLVRREKERRFQAIREKYKLFAKTDTKTET